MTLTLTLPSAFRYAGKGAVVPFHFQDNQPEVSGSVDGLAGWFAIDTGDNSSLLFMAPFARQHDLAMRYRADLPYDGVAVGATHGVWARRRPGSLSLNGADGRPVLSVREPVTRISLQTAGFDAHRELSGNIGLGFLRQFNLTFDYPNQRIIFEPSHFYGQKDVFNRSGLVLHRDGTGWRIVTLYPDSPATAAGIKSDDHIMRIDGHDAAGLSEDELAKLLRQEPGTIVTMELAGGDARRSVTLILRDIL